MKKKILLIICLVMANVSTFAQTASVMLLHEGGEPRFFNPAHIADALEAATDGDSLLLSEGSFAGNFIITKHVSLIGAGTKTVITGSINIELTDSLMNDTYMLDALYITDDINVNNAIDGLKMRKCTFRNISFNGRTDYSVIENCYCKGTLLLGGWAENNEKSKVVGLTVVNSKIENLTGDASADGAAVFEHCNVRLITIYGNTADNRCTLQGCIIGGWSMGLADYYGTPYGGKTIYINCLCDGGNYKSGNPARYTDCWDFYHETTQQNAKLLEELDYKGYPLSNYICSDGTVVGTTGGSLPFTLSPTLPTVSEASYSVDSKEKKLKVTLKVKTN